MPDEAAYWPEPIPPAPAPLDEALDLLLERSIEQGAIIAAIGPYTNLALLEKRSPGILRSANLVLMGGYVFPPRGVIRPGATTWTGTSRRISGRLSYVIERSNPTLVPLSVTVETALRRAYLPALRQAGPLARLIARPGGGRLPGSTSNETQYGQTCAGLPDDIINFQHDPLACAIALGWDDGVEISEIPLKLEIEDGWLVERVADAGKPTRVVTRVDGDRFNEFWLSRVCTIS